MNVSPHQDPSYIPSKNDESDDDEEEEVLKVFMEQMDQLLHLRPTCGAVVVSKKKKMSAQGSQMCVTLKCKNGQKHASQQKPIIYLLLAFT